MKTLVPCSTYLCNKVCMACNMVCSTLGDNTWAYNKAYSICWDNISAYSKEHTGIFFDSRKSLEWKLI